MRYRLRHATIYDYAEPVVLGTHYMHLVPRPRDGQRIVEANLHVTPHPDNRRNEVDHFGNFTTTVSMAVPHRQFVVELSATVEVAQPAAPEPLATPAWEEIAALAPRTAAVAEFCLASHLATPDPEIEAYARASFPPGRSMLAGLLALNRRIFDDMTYRGGVTTTSTKAAQVMKQRAGVCQDYAHLMIAALRALGLPARYVSGYLRTWPPPGQEKRRGADQSHAWAASWLGPDLGWIDLDPTNDLLVRNEHVTLAWGRDFGDVSPLRGIILGGGKHTLQVNVDLEPVLT